MRRTVALGLTMLATTVFACGGQPGDAAEAESSALTSLSPVLMGVDADANAEFVAATGLKTQVVRLYLGGGARIPASVAAAGLASYYSAGQAVVYSMKVDQSPDSEATNKANLAALAKDIKAKGYAAKTWIVLHHEPFPELSGTAFQSMYETYAPSVRSSGIRTGVIYQTYPIYHGTPNYPQEYTGNILPEVDFIGIDVYPGDNGYSVDILQTISPFTTYAKSNGKRFQIDEVAVSSAVSGSQEVQATWLDGLADLGGSADVLMYYEGSPGAFKELKIENNPAAVSAWKGVYAKLTTR